MKHLSLGILAFLALVAGCVSDDAPLAREVADRNCPADSFVAREAAPGARAAKPASMTGGAARTSNFTAVQGRQIAFTARLHLSSPDVPQAVRRAAALARESGGYAASLGTRACILKIPVAKAESALAELEKLGSVLSREINAQDVTDTVFDLEMRIANLEKLHAKLTALVEKAKDVKDILQVEKELSRVTGELEKLKATRLNLQRRVDFVTFNVNFTASTSPGVKTIKYLLPQATALGLWNDSLAVGEGETPDEPFDFDLPAGFIPVKMRRSDEFYAIDDQDTVLHAVSFDQIPGANLEFWCSAIARALRETRGYTVTAEIKTDKNGKQYALFRGERLRGKQPMRYEASCRIVTHLFTEDEVRVVEALGTRERMEKLDLSKTHESTK